MKVRSSTSAINHKIRVRVEDFDLRAQVCAPGEYQCQRESDDDRAMRRADAIRRRLGWEAGIANPDGGNPKGMHGRTFERLQAEYSRFARASWAGLGERLGLMNRRLDKLGRNPFVDLDRDR